MNPNTVLTEEGWKEVAPECKGKDKDLLKALFFYWTLEDDDFEFRGKALGKIAALAGTLKGANEVKSDRDAVKYLADVVTAVKAKQTELVKAKAEAEKAAATTQKKAEAEAKKRADEEAEAEAEEEGGEESEEEDEDDSGDYRENLKTVFKRLKSTKELVYHFIVCDAKPQCGLILSKQRITSKHKTDLTKLTGSKRFLKPGTCYVDGGKLVLDMEKAPSGLAVKIKKAFKYFTGLNIGVVVGDQSDEKEGEPTTETGSDTDTDADTDSGAEPKLEPKGRTERGAEAPAAVEPPTTPARATLERAPEVWQQTRGFIDAKVEQLKTAIRREFADEGDDLLADIEENMNKLDGILDNLDQKLSDSLAKAHEANTPAARKSELSQAKMILAKYIKYVKAEPLIDHIDHNPFGVATNLKRTLIEKLTHMAQAIG